MNDIPDYFGELTGWRKFALRGSGTGSVLVSANHPIPWTSADMGPAVCLTEPTQMTSYGNMLYQPRQIHETETCPALHCCCGYYAYRQREDALRHLQASILVRVALWGRVVQHQRGYRAERMRIAEIFLPKGHPQCEALAARYKVTVTEDEIWTSENQNTLSSLNQSLNQLQNPFLQQAQIPQVPYLSAQYLQNYQQQWFNAAQTGYQPYRPVGSFAIVQQEEASEKPIKGVPSWATRFVKRWGWGR